MIEAIQHPDDASRLLPVDDAITGAWRSAATAQADISALATRADGIDKGITDLLADSKSQQATIDALTSRLDAQQAAIAAVGVRVDAVEKALATLPKSGAAFGVDVGKDQTTEQVKAALQGSPDFCIINTTSGLMTVSPALSANVSVSRDWADITGFYHWGLTVNGSATTPDKSDPIGEARHFLDTAPFRVGDLLVLDNEQDLGTWQQKLAYDIAWLEFVAQQTGATPLNYKNWNWITNLRTVATVDQWARWSRFPIWLADPSGVPGKHSWISPKSGTSTAPVILLHQYDTTGGMDKDWTPDIAGLRSLGVKYLAA